MEPSCMPPSHRPMSSPGYSSARLRPRRAGLRFARCAQLTNGLIQHRSCSDQTQHFFYSRSSVVEEPAHAEKQHAREPGDLLDVLVERSRPVREGHKPNGGHERSGEVGLCRSTSEPAEQRSASFRGGWGGKGADYGEHRSISHEPDTERGTHVPGIARCATSSKRKEAGTLHRFATP